MTNLTLPGFSRFRKIFRLFTETVGDAIIPKRYRKEVFNYFQKASRNRIPYFEFGIYVYLMLFLSVFLDVFVLQTKYFSNTNLFIMLIISIILMPIFFIVMLLFITQIYKTYLDAKIYHKVQKMEEVFPEFLSELSLNLKAGQSLEEALENSLEREFGYLKDEIERVCKKIRLGSDAEVAIKEFTNNFNSDMIEESFNLIILSWKKGAKTPSLIDRLVENIQETRFLRKKIIASVGSYRIFLSLVTIIFAPAMFAMAFYMIGLIRSVINKILESSIDVNSPFTINVIRVNDYHFIWFSVLALTLISICCAIIISIIKTKTIKEGYKQILLYPIGSIISFRIFMFFFSLFFSLFKI